MGYTTTERTTYCTKKTAEESSVPLTKIDTTDSTQLYSNSHAKYKVTT